VRAPQFVRKVAGRGPCGSSASAVCAVNQSCDRAL